MIRRPPRSTQSRSSAASDVYKRQLGVLRRQAAAGGHVDDQLDLVGVRREGGRLAVDRHQRDVVEVHVMGNTAGDGSSPGAQPTPLAGEKARQWRGRLAFVTIGAFRLYVPLRSCLSMKSAAFARERYVPVTPSPR